MNHIVLATILVLVGLVLGGAEMLDILKLTESTSVKDTVDNSTTSGTRATESLQHIVVMSRHGNRGGSVDYPDDPYLIGDVTYWPYGQMQLTNKGRQQTHSLGKRLRTLYNGFLNTTYNPENVKSFSDVDYRVIMSGQMVLQGLFPPKGFEVWNSNINWQPVALFTNSSDKSLNTLTCDRFKAEKAEVYSIFEEENAVNISEIIEYFYNYSNETYTATELSYIFEKIYSEVTEGYTLPSELADVFPDPFVDFYKKNYVASFAGTDKMTRLVIGNLYEEILDAMKSKINGSAPDLNMNFYSAHDCSILNLQIALGMPRDSIISWVKVASALVIELHKNSSSEEYYVKVIYIDGSSLDSEPTPLSLPDCGEPCYYDALVNSTLQFTNIRYEEECQLTDSESTTSSDI